MPNEPLHEPFSLTKGETGITQQDGLDASTDWGQIFEYQVPVGIGLIILPGHTFSCYLHGDDGAEMPATTQVRILHKDSSKSGDAKKVLGPILYVKLKEFTNKNKIAIFDILNPAKIYEKQYLTIETAGADATGTGGVDVTGGTKESYFEAAISRVRQPL